MASSLRLQCFTVCKQIIYYVNNMADALGIAIGVVIRVFGISCNFIESSVRIFG